MGGKRIKKYILVQYSGSPDQTLDTQIERTAKKCKLEYDGSGFDLVKHMRDHFVYGTSTFRIQQFQEAIKSLSKLSAIKITTKVQRET